MLKNKLNWPLANNEMWLCISSHYVALCEIQTKAKMWYIKKSKNRGYTKNCTADKTLRNVEDMWYPWQHHFVVMKRVAVRYQAVGTLQYLN